MAGRYPSPDHTQAYPFTSGYTHVNSTHDRNVSRNVQERNDAPHSQQVSGDAHLRAEIEHMIDNHQFNGASYGQFGVLPGDGSHQVTAQHAANVEYTQDDANAGHASREKAPRSKTSRACDECRRRKIRCDAIDESGNAPCSPCSRAGLQCAFTRQQMKRGPSKGYIKNLAERLQQLEQQVSDPSSSTQFIESRRAQSSNQNESRVEPRTGDKRLFSATEDYSPHSSWDAASTVSQSLHSNQHAQTSPPTARSQQPFWRMASSTVHDLIALPFEQSSVDLYNSASIATFDWDEDVIGEYYRLIHQTFPLLPNSKTRLRYRLAECPATLREAFLSALDCLTRTFPTSSLSPTASYHITLKRAAESLAKYPFDNPSSHTPATNLAYLQTLLIMAMETDNHGPATIRGQAGPSRAEWLGRAAGVAGQLEINTIRSEPPGSSLLTGDRDSEDRLARRVWWVLFILDRWHASSTADLLKLPEKSVLLLPEDQILLGESTYHLARLSFIIGHLAAILTTTKTPSTDVMAPSNPASSLLTLTLAGEIDRFRESVESVWGSLNLVHLSYHHVHLLIKRLNPLSEPAELVEHAVKVATVLNSRATPLTPLNHHFAALSAMTLCELADQRPTRAQALRGLTELRSCLGGGRGLAGHEGSEGWDGAVRDLVVEKLDRIERGSDGDAFHGLNDQTPFDPTMLTRYGYLTALAQGMVKTR